MELFIEKMQIKEQGVVFAEILRRYLDENENKYFIEWKGGEGYDANTSDYFKVRGVEDSQPYKSETQAIDLAKRHASLEGKILDIASGPGRITKIIQEEGYNIDALDNSKEVLDIAKEQGIKNIIHTDITQYTGIPENTYDVALLLFNGFGVAGTEEKTLDMLSEIDRITNDEALLIVHSFYYNHIPENSTIRIGYEEKNEKVSSEWFPWLYKNRQGIERILEKNGIWEIKGQIGVKDGQDMHYILGKK